MLLELASSSARPQTAALRDVSGPQSSVQVGPQSGNAEVEAFPDSSGEQRRRGTNEKDTNENVNGAIEE